MKDIEDTYALVVCRGASAQYVIDNPALHIDATRIFKTNVWTFGEPEFLNCVKSFSGNGTTFENISKGYKAREGENWDELKKVAYDAWAMVDRGLEAIVHASFLYRNIAIAGFDLWESDYWVNCRVWRKGPAIMHERIRKGTHIKNKVLISLFEFMRKKQDTKFHFHTLSRTLHDKQKEEKLPNVTVELVKKKL